MRIEELGSLTVMIGVVNSIEHEFIVLCCPSPRPDRATSRSHPGPWAQPIHISAATSMPTILTTATCVELRDAASLLDPAVEEEALDSEVEEEDDEDDAPDDEPDEVSVAVAVALLETYETRLPVAPALVELLETVWMEVSIMVSSVTVLVMVEVWVMVVVSRGVSCARARRGSRAAMRMLVNCIVTVIVGDDFQRVNPR